MNQNIWTLDLPGLVAGAKYRGEFEAPQERDSGGHRSRRRHPVYRRDAHHHRCRLCRGLHRRELHAQTRARARCLSDYRCHHGRGIPQVPHQDPAFERRFQTIDVEEPSVEDTVKILTALSRATRSITMFAIRRVLSRPPRTFPTATSRIASCPIRPSTSSTRPVPALASPRIARPSRCARPSIA